MARTSFKSKTNSCSANASSIVGKLSMLRSFVANDTFSETDLSTCLRQAGYNVELAAERLMTGQYQPAKRQKVFAAAPSASLALASNTRPRTMATPKAPPAVVTTTTITTATKIRKPTPVTPKTPSPSFSTAQNATTTNTNNSNRRPSKYHATTKPSGSRAASQSSTTTTANSLQSIENSWLLCHRWISDGICLQRNGSVAYEESLQVEHSNASSSSSSSSSSPSTSSSSLSKSNPSKASSTVRFRGSRIQGQFPKHLSPLLGPLLEAQLIQVQAQALMEERCLPIGMDVAFAVWIYLPDPAKFMALLDPSSSDTTTTNSSSDSNKLFFGKAKSGSSSSSRNGQSSVLQQAAFGLLQWAQHGETFDFQSPPTVETDSSSPSNNKKRSEIRDAVNNISSSSSSSSSSEGEEEEEEVLMEDDEDYNPANDEEKATDNALAKDLIAPTNNKVAELQELEASAEFKVKLRPYQRQALWWMRQREAQEELEASSRQQLELLEELVAQQHQQQQPSTASSSTSSTTTTTAAPSSSSTPILCECGPVQVDTIRIQAPAVLDALRQDDDDYDFTEGTSSSNPDLKHPLWERRYLTNASKTKAMSFYVQPLFGAAMATPPPPPRPCRGGILADSMGLGKTVMLLALIQSSLVDKDEKRASSNHTPTTTLIVSPLSLLAQWQEEIETKTTMTHRVYYGDKKQLDDTTFDAVDIVLTTYGSLQGEWLSHSKQLQKEGGGNGIGGGLLGHTWSRVILDEAHCIKNTATVASRACCLLQAERRWCVSGTIIQNSLDDVYSLLKFLRHEPWCQQSFWKAAISAQLRSNDNKQQALDRVRRLLTPIMLRRTKESVDKDGNPILILPPVETKIISVDFTPAERQFYDALHQKSLSLFQGFIQAGTASKSWLAIFSLLHRLRQTCDHVALTVKAHLDDDEWASNIAKSQDETKAKKDAASVSTSATKDAIDKRFLDDLMGKFRSMQATTINGGKKKGSSQTDDAPYAAKIAKMLNEAVQSKSSLLKEECSICLEPISIHDSVVTPCFHIFCKECLVGVLQQQQQKQQVDSSQEDEEHNKPPSFMYRLPNGPCPVCNETIQSPKILRLSESDGRIQTCYLLNSMSPLPAPVKEGDGVARQTLETAVRGSASSKLTSILLELDNVWNEEPGSKVLIFSQFLGFLDLMEESFKTSQIPFSRLDGKLSLKERKAVLEEFGSDNGGRQLIAGSPTRINTGSVLLISMKAGGVGLNLTAARTVFIADPWWNAAVEDQCVDRIHRIGQNADKVRVRKFYVTNSVEERIVELQKRKKNVASEVLCDKGQDDTESQAGTLPTLDDFKILFREGGGK